MNPVTVVAAQRGKSAVFAALHDPFNGKPDVERFEQIARTGDALAARVVGKPDSGIDDRLMVRVGDATARPITLSGGGESFTFVGHAFVRVGQKQVIARGDLRGLRLKVGDAEPVLLLNGRKVEAKIADGVLTWSN